MPRWLVVVALLSCGLGTAGASVAAPAGPGSLEPAEADFLDVMDASSALAAIDSGLWASFDGRDRAGWQRYLEQRRIALRADFSRIEATGPGPDDAAALAAMRRSVAALDAEVATDAPEQRCADAARQDLDYAALRGALVSCFIEIGNNLNFEGATIDRSRARGLLQEIDEPARRRALFTALQPLWSAVNGRSETDSPYRRMIAMAAAAAAVNGSEISAAARTVGLDPAGLERWLVAILATWAEAAGPAMVEPWDYSYEVSMASRWLAQRILPGDLARYNSRYWIDLGAHLDAMGVVFDLAPRPGKSPLAYTDFIRRGRPGSRGWQPPLARVVATYEGGGLSELSELVHESAHAAHISAIRTRPAFMDWPDSLFAEAFADVASWSVYEPVWQRRYLSAELPSPVALRALFGSVMLDVAWSLFEMRMLRDPAADPNVVWTDITGRYLRIVPHRDLAWWVLRVQLVESPGYMINYGLGAVLTADMRQAIAAAIGPFDAGNARWYPWVSERLLRFGSERNTQQLMTALLGRPATPQSLLTQIRRILPAPPRSANAAGHRRPPATESGAP